MSFAFNKRIGGRRVKGKCAVPTKTNRHHRVCERTVQRGTLSFAGHAGPNTVIFQGRISRSKKLRPGRYMLVLTATNSAGARSAAKSLSFEIVE